MTLNGSPKQFISQLEMLDLDLMAMNIEAKRLWLPKIERLKLFWAGRLVRRTLEALINPELDKRLVVYRNGKVITLNRKSLSY